ncbi:copper chaperone PCu(A)C [Microbispora sp. NBC_01189]|uniref:copper chaperone PCu(A)C n=1 Tax=unclassified Microbispora TaxID=2614687 RepID=UPI002E0D4B18|nr:copper chaperone PCu(A)C [Microbispora sp. NBC_01189]
MFSRVMLVVLSLGAVTATAACGSEGTSSVSSAAPSAVAVAASPSSSAVALSITDPWVKTTKKGMTAAFGTLVNNSDSDVTVIAGSTPAAPMVELHEVVESKGKMVMRPKEGGFVVPAHGSHVLQPGGDHIMVMDVPSEIKPGSEVPFTLELQGGGTYTFTALGKDFAGAKENYQPGADMDGMG